MDAALADCEHALKLDARLAETWSQRGLVRLGKGDLAGALADFDQALKLNPQLADGYANRGHARLIQGNAAEAEADFVRCRALGGKLKPEVEQWLDEVKQRRAPRK